jgi:hypothetical protein
MDNFTISHSFPPLAANCPDIKRPFPGGVPRNIGPPVELFQAGSLQPGECPAAGLFIPRLHDRLARDLAGFEPFVSSRALPRNITPPGRNPNPGQRNSPETRRD